IRETVQQQQLRLHRCQALEERLGVGGGMHVVSLLPQHPADGLHCRRVRVGNEDTVRGHFRQASTAESPATAGPSSDCSPAQSMLPPLSTATVALPGCTRPESRAATVMAPLGSATSLARSSRKRTASRISASGTVTTSSTND